MKINESLVRYTKTNNVPIHQQQQENNKKMPLTIAIQSIGYLKIHLIKIYKKSMPKITKFY